MKTTFDFNFYSYQAVKQHECTYKEKSREVVNWKIYPLITCKFVIRKRLANNPILNKEDVFILSIQSTVFKQLFVIKTLIFCRLLFCSLGWPLYLFKLFRFEMMSPAQQCGSGPGGFPFFSPHISNPYHDQVQILCNLKDYSWKLQNEISLIPIT